MLILSSGDSPTNARSNSLALACSDYGRHSWIVAFKISKPARFALQAFCFPIPAALAQLVERLLCKQLVERSIRSDGTSSLRLSLPTSRPCAICDCSPAPTTPIHRRQPMRTARVNAVLPPRAAPVLMAKGENGFPSTRQAGCKSDGALLLEQQELIQGQQD